MAPTIEEVALLLARAGVDLQAAEVADIRAAYAMLAPMLASLREPAIPLSAEPAFTMRAERR
jgi:hypothetical protein